MNPEYDLRSKKRHTVAAMTRLLREWGFDKSGSTCWLRTRGEILHGLFLQTSKWTPPGALEARLVACATASDVHRIVWGHDFKYFRSDAYYPVRFYPKWYVRGTERPPWLDIAKLPDVNLTDVLERTYAKVVSPVFDRIAGLPELAKELLSEGTRHTSDPQVELFVAVLQAIVDNDLERLRSFSNDERFSAWAGRALDAASRWEARRGVSP